MGKDRFITYMQDQYPARWGDGHHFNGYHTYVMDIKLYEFYKCPSEKKAEVLAKLMNKNRSLFKKKGLIYENNTFYSIIIV